MVTATLCDAAAATPYCRLSAPAAAPWRASALPAGVYLQAPRLFLHASHHDTRSKPGERLSVVVAALGTPAHGAPAASARISGSPGTHSVARYLHMFSPPARG